MHTIGSITLRGQALAIPNRIYLPEPGSAGGQGDEQLVRACLYTRHHDGFVRERQLQHLLGAEAPIWVLPFVVRLLGEYVIEIVERIAAQADGATSPSAIEFASENTQFLHLTRQRAASAWACYYRSRFRRFSEYPAARVLHAMQRAASRARSSTKEDASSWPD